MRLKLFIFGIFLLLLTSLIIYNLTNNPITVFKEGTKIGNIDLSRLPLNKGLSLLKERFNNPIYLNTDSTSRAVNLKDMGISYDENEILKAATTCLFRKPLMFCQNTSNEPVDINGFITIDKKMLDTYLADLEAQMQYAAKNTIISFDDFSFSTPSDKAKITLDKSAFKSPDGINSLIDNKPIKIKLVLNNDDDLTAQHLQTLKLINLISQPLLIKYGRNPIYIPAQIVNSFVTTIERNGELYGLVSSKEISNYLDILKLKYENQDVKIVRPEAVKAIQTALLYRTTDYKVNTAVILPLQGKPKTNGETADVYLEVLKSQQRLYKFEHGKLTKTYIISTGLTWETPSGNYEILGKQKMTISYFGNWYMPYYMPIGLINGKYRFGFHAIPYHVDASGNIYSRDLNTMGSPATGGCIQLTLEDAEELFTWGKIGIPVYVYE